MRDLNDSAAHPPAPAGTPPSDWEAVVRSHKPGPRYALGETGDYGQNCARCGSEWPCKDAEFAEAVDEDLLASPAGTPPTQNVERDALRYRALRLGLTVHVGEDGELGVGCTVARSEQDNTEEPITELEAPFLTADERADLNGIKPDSKGYLRGADVIDRIADFVVAETKVALLSPAGTPREPDDDEERWATLDELVKRVVTLIDDDAFFAKHKEHYRLMLGQAVAQMGPLSAIPDAGEVSDDTKRLDWLESQAKPHHGVIVCASDVPGEEFVSLQRVDQWHNPHKVEWCHEALTIRAAIDLALAASRQADA